jgi:hypothetical protein
MPLLAGLAAIVASCSGTQVSDVNKPLSQAEISIDDTGGAQARVQDFAAKNHFAIQPLVTKPQGAVMFSMRLFRDDLSVMVTVLPGSALRITAYPLCACELNRRIGLKSAADAVVTELKREIEGTDNP